MVGRHETKFVEGSNGNRIAVNKHGFYLVARIGEKVELNLVSVPDYDTTGGIDETVAGRARVDREF